jgi:putative ABC transport system permease protein
MSRAPALALLRLAGRNVGRSLWRSLLVVVLVMLPVAGMVGVTTVMKTITPTAERIVTARMGDADFEVFAGEGGTGELLRQRVPPGSTVEPLLRVSDKLALPGLKVEVGLTSYDPEGLAHAMLTLRDGRMPTAEGEVAASAEVVRLSGAAIGSQIELAELGSQTIVGLVENPLRLKDRLVYAGPWLAQLAEASANVEWLVKFPAGVDPSILDLDLPTEVQGEAPTGDGSTPPAFIVTPRGYAITAGNAVGAATIVLGGLALVNAALVAAAAFGVGIRRRQRELGILAATGAQPRHLAGSVLAEALVLGGLGAVVGIVVGIAGAFVLSPFLDELTGQRNPLISPDLAVLVIGAAMGMIAALVAAVVPAWSAGRMPVLAALSGRRPPTNSSTRGLVLGVILVATGFGLTSFGALLRLNTSDTSTSTLMLFAGAVLGTLGFGACSPWLLGRLERPSARLPVTSRIALRDLARARSRNGPIVTALLAAFAATVALSSYQASVEASNRARYQPSLHADQLLIQGPGFAEAGPDAAAALGAIASGPMYGVGNDDRGAWISPADTYNPEVPHTTAYLAVVNAELAKALGVEAAWPDLEAGKIVFLSEKSFSVDKATVHIVSKPEFEDIDRVVLPASVFVTGLFTDELPAALLSEATFERLGLEPGRSDTAPSDRYLIRLGHPVTDDDLGKAASFAAAYPDTQTYGSLPSDRGANLIRLVMIAGALLFALSVTGIAVALGEAESRPEQRTLLAIGADPRMRRRIAAARAGVIALLGGGLAVPAGLLPVWGLLASRGADMVVPVPEILAALAVLPLLAIAGTWLLSKPIPDWSAFRAQASG